uniref:TOG domain-containing protein n=1 Tax=Elaeophora elaphi TaxID=1147741 RepID=A0A0R3RZR1_9BILA
MDQVDITGDLPPGFFETIRSAKWDERRDVLSALIDSLSRHSSINPKVKYNEIVSELKLILLKDSNINVVILALRALTAFVKGLRRNFMKYIPMVLLHILEKFKEKKAVVKEAVMECLSLVAEYCDTTILTDPICEALEKTTNPNMKAGIDQWIYCILCRYPRSAAPMAFIKSVAPYLAKHSKDSDPNVRERSCMVFGAILRLVEEKITASIADGIFSDETKLKKIMEYLEKAEKDFEAYEQTRTETDIALESCASGENMEHYKESAGDLVQPDAEISSWELLTETKISDKIPCDIQKKLASKRWSDRKETLEILCRILENNPRLCPDEDHSELIGILREILEKDANINVAVVAAKCITGFANGLRYGFATFIPKIYVSVFEKFKEKKLILREPLIELCDVLALLTPLSAYIEVVEAALRNPNPQIKTQTALFLSRLLRQHSMHTLSLNCIREKLGPALTKLSFDADGDSREASFIAVGAIMKIAGENIVNECCKAMMKDVNKSAKVREHYEKLMQEFGPNASVAILKLHQKTKSTVGTAKVDGSDKAFSAGARTKGSKGDVKITKKVSYDAAVSRSKSNNAIMPAARIKSIHSVVSATSMEVKYIQLTGTDEAKNHEKNNSSEKDVFFDAVEKMEIVSDNSVDSRKSLKGNELCTVKERKPGVAAAEESISSQFVNRERKQHDAGDFTVPSVRNYKSRLPIPTSRGTSGSRIPLPVCRRI